MTALFAERTTPLLPRRFCEKCHAPAVRVLRTLVCGALECDWTAPRFDECQQKKPVTPKVTPKVTPMTRAPRLTVAERAELARMVEEAVRRRPGVTIPQLCTELRTTDGRLRQAVADLGTAVVTDRQRPARLWAASDRRAPAWTSTHAQEQT